jgi:hypothetical protein
MLLIIAKANKTGLLALDAGGELLLAYHAIALAPSTATKHQHQAFFR